MPDYFKYFIITLLIGFLFSSGKLQAQDPVSEVAGKSPTFRFKSGFEKGEIDTSLLENILKTRMKRVVREIAVNNAADIDTTLYSSAVRAIIFQIANDLKELSGSRLSSALVVDVVILSMTLEQANKMNPAVAYEHLFGVPPGVDFSASDPKVIRKIKENAALLEITFWIRKLDQLLIESINNVSEFGDRQNNPVYAKKAKRLVAKLEKIKHDLGWLNDRWGINWPNFLEEYPVTPLFGDPQGNKDIYKVKKSDGTELVPSIDQDAIKRRFDYICDQGGGPIRCGGQLGKSITHLNSLKMKELLGSYVEGDLGSLLLAEAINKSVMSVNDKKVFTTLLDAYSSGERGPALLETAVGESQLLIQNKEPLIAVIRAHAEGKKGKELMKTLINGSTFSPEEKYNFDSEIDSVANIDEANRLIDSSNLNIYEKANLKVLWNAYLRDNKEGLELVWALIDSRPLNTKEKAVIKAVVNLLTTGSGEHELQEALIAATDLGASWEGSLNTILTAYNSGTKSVSELKRKVSSLANLTIQERAAIKTVLDFNSGDVTALDMVKILTNNSRLNLKKKMEIERFLKVLEFFDEASGSDSLAVVEGALVYLKNEKPLTAYCAEGSHYCSKNLKVIFTVIEEFPNFIEFDNENQEHVVQIEEFMKYSIPALEEQVLTFGDLNLYLAIGISHAWLPANPELNYVGTDDDRPISVGFFHEKIGLKYNFGRVERWNTPFHINLYVGGILYRLSPRNSTGYSEALGQQYLYGVDIGMFAMELVEIDIFWNRLEPANDTIYGINFSIPIIDYLNEISQQ